MLRNPTLQAHARGKRFEIVALAVKGLDETCFKVYRRCHKVEIRRTGP